VSKDAAIPYDFAMDLPPVRNGAEKEIYWSLSCSYLAVSRSGRHAWGRSLIIDTGRVTPGTRATGGTAKLVDGPGTPTCGASEGLRKVLADFCCLVSQSSLCVMSPFRKQATAAKKNNSSES